MLGGFTNVDIQSLGVVALLLFVVAFLAIVVRVLTRSRAEVEHQARLPLDDGEPRGKTRSEGASS